MTEEGERIAALERRLADLEARMNVLPAFAPIERSINAIVLMAAQAWGVTAADIYSDRRAGLFAAPRQAVMWVARHTLPYSYPRIGQALGGRDHTTIMHGVSTVERKRRRDLQLRRLTDHMVAAMERLQSEAEQELAALEASPELQLEAAE